MPKVIGIVDGSHDGSVDIERLKGIPYQHKTTNRTYYVLADTCDQNEENIYLTPGVPRIYDRIEGHLVTSLRARQVNTVIHPNTGAAAALWEIQVATDNKINIEDDNSQGPGASPKDRRATVRWSSQKKQVVLEKDVITGDKVQTANDEPFMAEREIVLPELSITRFEDYPFDQDIIRDYCNKVCNHSFWGFPANSALMDEISAEDVDLEGEWFSQVQYRILFYIPDVPDFGEPWKAHLLHQGTKVRPAPNEDPEVAVDKFGNPYVVNLDQFGVELQPGDPPNYRSFHRYKKRSFRNLNIDKNDIYK